MLADRSADPHLVNGSDAISNRDEVEANAASHRPRWTFLGTVAEMLPYGRIPCMALVHHANCRRLSVPTLTIVLDSLVERVGNVAAGTHWKPQRQVIPLPRIQQ